MGNTQQRCGANKQEPRGHAKVWHLLGRLGIHKPNPECILKPAAADVGSMAEGWSGGSQSRSSLCSVQLCLPLLKLSQEDGELDFPHVTDEISMIKTL